MIETTILPGNSLGRTPDCKRRLHAHKEVPAQIQLKEYGIKSPLCVIRNINSDTFLKKYFHLDSVSLQPPMCFV